MSQLIKLSAWQALAAHHRSLKDTHMATLFAHDPHRFTEFSLHVGAILLDYSKNRIIGETLNLLENLAHAVALPEKIALLFTENALNNTERRAVLHTALRAPSKSTIYLQGKNVSEEVHACLQKMQTISEKIRTRQWLGAQGLPITNIVYLGIGGSDQGPRLVTQALAQCASSDITFHFVSNIDGAALQTVLQRLKPANTLTIIASKSFTTRETLLNAQAIRAWFADESQFAKQCLAITEQRERALAFGVLAENILPLWDWVGGRYSVWSAIGLPIAIALGMPKFYEFLAGAHAMDEHFRTAPLLQNMPVILALLNIWYNNFFHTHTQAIIPYADSLQNLPAYLQQLIMESNGKRVTCAGEVVEYATAPVIWGGVGSCGQHAFHQLLMQGTQLIPVDFIIARQALHDLPSHQRWLVAECLSQSAVLMLGYTAKQVTEQLQEAGLAQEEIARLVPHKVMLGNKPSNTLVLDQLTPSTLGSLLALYEHRVFVEGLIWNINSFDQWGVEWGKHIAQDIYAAYENALAVTDWDSSTASLIQYCQKK